MKWVFYFLTADLPVISVGHRHTLALLGADQQSRNHHIKFFLVQSAQYLPNDLVAAGYPVALANLTDDELLRAIAQNTETLSILLDQQLESNKPPGGSPTMPMHSNGRSIDALERQYRIYSAELRRRHP
jgi:hypothetical protein